MTSRSGGLKPSAVAGSPSVTRFTHSSCTGARPSGMPSAAVKKMEATSPAGQSGGSLPGAKPEKWMKQAKALADV